MNRKTRLCSLLFSSTLFFQNFLNADSIDIEALVSPNYEDGTHISDSKDIELKVEVRRNKGVPRTESLFNVRDSNYCKNFICPITVNGNAGDLIEVRAYTISDGGAYTSNPSPWSSKVLGSYTPSQTDPIFDENIEIDIWNTIFAGENNEQNNSISIHETSLIKENTTFETPIDETFPSKSTIEKRLVYCITSSEYANISHIRNLSTGEVFLKSIFTPDDSQLSFKDECYNINTLLRKGLNNIEISTIDFLGNNEDYKLITTNVNSISTPSQTTLLDLINETFTTTDLRDYQKDFYSPRTRGEVFKYDIETPIQITDNTYLTFNFKNNDDKLSSKLALQIRTNSGYYYGIPIIVDDKKELIKYKVHSSSFTKGNSPPLKDSNKLPINDYINRIQISVPKETDISFESFSIIKEI